MRLPAWGIWLGEIHFLPGQRPEKLAAETNITPLKHGMPDYLGMGVCQVEGID